MPKRSWKILLGVLGFSLLLPVFLGAQERLEGEHIVVDYPEGMRDAAQRIINVYPGLRRDCEARLGYRYPRLMTVRIFRTHDEFSADIVKLGGSAPPAFVAAVAFPLIDVVILKSEAWTRAGPEQFAITFQHEISHCLLGHLRRVFPKMEVPRWFDEGVAQWVSEGLFHGDSAQLHRALRENDWIPFDEIEDRFPRQEGASELAYAQSESMVRFIAEFGDRRLERRNIPELILQLTTGVPFDDALKTVTGKRLSGLEKAWSRQKRSPFPIPLRLFPEVFFSVTIVVLALLAFAIYRVKRARRLEELAAADAALVTEDDTPQA